MSYKKQISDYIDAHIDDMVKDTMDLCRINSVGGAYEEGKPYGDGPYIALMAAKQLCEKYGFKTTNYDNYVITADMGDNERHLDILAHMDVVAPGDGWTVTEPFDPVVKDGKIYGRGTSDDKGPAVAALYAMRAVKELGIPVSKNCRLILGSDEERGSNDIVHYYAKEPEAPMTFSPDAEFPLTNVEKGQFRGILTAKFDKTEGVKDLVEFNGGTTTNIVPGKAYAIISADFNDDDIRVLADEVTKETGVSFEIAGNENGLKINAEGKGAHASLPEDGNNAVLALLCLMTRIPFTESKKVNLVRELSRLFPYGDHFGRAMGIDLRDDIAGPTTVSMNIVKVDSDSIFANFDSRTCIDANEENTVAPAKKACEEAGFEFEHTYVAPHAVPADSDFVKTLLGAYESVTGLPGRCIAMGGGTYVHHLKNGVAFGAVGETTDTHMHGADEFMLISELTDAAKIFAISIADLCR